MTRPLLVTLAAFVAAAATVAPARADGPVSVYAGEQFTSQSAGNGNLPTVQTDLGLGFDFGPQIVVPVRARFQLDDAFANNGNGHVGSFGAGFSARLTTPIYAGVGLSLYNVNARVDLPNTSVSDSRTGVGTNIFVGSKLFSAPAGVGLALEGSYKNVPSVLGLNSSVYGVGLRLSL